MLRYDIYLYDIYLCAHKIDYIDSRVFFEKKLKRNALKYIYI